LSALVAMRRFHTACASTIACISRSRPAPVSPDTATIGTPATCGSQWSASRRNFAAAGGRAIRSDLFMARTSARPSCSTTSDERAPSLLDRAGDAQILLLERFLRVNQHPHHAGKTAGAEGGGEGEFFQLLVAPRAPAQARRVVQAERPAVPIEIDRDGVAGNP